MDNYPNGTSACFDIGISGMCKGNCYLCSAYEEDNLTDDSIAEKIGKEKQELMLRELGV